MRTDETAMKWKLNIVPVMKEDFVVPAKSSLPVSCQSILSYNAIKWEQAYKHDAFNRLLSALVP